MSECSVWDEVVGGPGEAVFLLIMLGSAMIFQTHQIPSLFTAVLLPC